MKLEQRLNELVIKAAQDFDSAASEERKVFTDDEGSLHNDFLDQILEQQKEQRQALWKELYDLEEQCHNAQMNKVLGPRMTQLQQKLLSTKFETQELEKEIIYQQTNVDELPFPPNDIVTEIQFRNRLANTNLQLRSLASFLIEELATKKQKLFAKRTTVSETKTIHTALTNRLNEIKEEGPVTIPAKIRQELNSVRQRYLRTMDFLIDFMDEHYPPHAVDGKDLRTMEHDDVCELKFILEDLMNRSVIDPSNPYIHLQPGTYWTPYIETLIKAGIAQRHPLEPDRLALVDFRLYTD
ncbi:hypothetical protein DM01DRAFT_1308140 [Hesseltinella vesiculosa]|uniref:Centromere protein K n=1 Tax=Hesseltinella vesiculosa TaxID=101127 RepID=A0A1X2GC40_9FUNG|nr:hypothetical protein DM01DRAFT_1308140 [Hesseltinella vesiculosa]